MCALNCGMGMEIGEWEYIYTHCISGIRMKMVEWEYGYWNANCGMECDYDTV